MNVGDLVRWADCRFYRGFCGIILKTWGDYPDKEVLVWLPRQRDTEWCFSYDLKVIK